MTEQPSPEQHPRPDQKSNFPIQEASTSFYGRVTRTFKPELLNEMKSYIQTGQILDNGASFGETTNELLQIFGENPGVHLVGLDINPKYLQLARESQGIPKVIAPDLEGKVPPPDISPKNRITWIEQNGYFPEFPDNSFDIVFMMNNLYVVVETATARSAPLVLEQLKTILNNQFAILRPGGLLCISGSAFSPRSTYPYIIFGLDENKKPFVFRKFTEGQQSPHDKKLGYLEPTEVIEFIESGITE